MVNVPTQEPKYRLQNTPGRPQDPAPALRAVQGDVKNLRDAVNEIQAVNVPKMVNGPYAAGQNDNTRLIQQNAPGTITLPTTPTGIAGTVVNASSSAILVKPASGPIAGQASVSVAPHDSVSFYYDGSAKTYRTR
jgi:hypothetical protein